jgi:amino acid adenylation domain-containing protein
MMMGGDGQPGNTGMVPHGMQQLSFAQQGLWFLDQLTPGSTAYAFQADYEITGPLDIPAFSKAVDHVMLRHAVLRSRIAVVGGTPYAVVVPPGCAALEVADLRGSPDPRRRALRMLRDRARWPFDLAAGPLFRSTLIQVAEDAWIMDVNVHHAVFDGESRRIFERDLAAAYASFVQGRSPRLAPLPLTYATFAAEQGAWLRGPEAASEIAYWTRRLRGAAQAELPADWPRQQVLGFAGDEVAIRFPKGTSRLLEELARERRTTFFVVMLAAHQYLLSRYTGALETVVGVPFSGRIRVELEQLIGFFVNPLALRGSMRGNPSFAQLVDRVRGVVLEAADHQEIPFERVVASLAPERDLRRNPVFQNWFDFESRGSSGYEGESLSLAGVDCRRIEHTATTTRFDTEFHISMPRDELRGRLVYATELFDRARMRQLADHYVALLGAMAESPHQRLAEFPLLSAAETREIIELGCVEGPAPGAGSTLAEWFEGRADADPDAVAVTDGESTLTYGELRERADRVAGWLRDRGAGPEKVVGVCVPRSTDLAVALLGIVRAGAAYLPMDPELPVSRLAFMLADTAAAHIVTCAPVRHMVPGNAEHVLCLGEFPQNAISGPRRVYDVRPDNALYVIYTSGSTGEPKGVAITHRSFCNLVRWHLITYQGHDGEDVVSAVANGAFDAAGWEIWSALLGGARLDIVPTEFARAPDLLVEHLARAGTTSMFVPTPLAEQLVRMPLARRTRLRYLLTGGDVFRPRREDAPGVPVFNHYGPTEATVVATVGDALGPPWRDVSIGRPIAGARAYVLDRYLHPVPKGVSGELFIGGAGVGRGYFSRPALTAERFSPDPFAAVGGARMYQTGDIVRWRPDGTLAFLGRADRQVKIRGFRIEPGEIESAILGFPGIRDAVVVQAGGEQAGHDLVAYLTSYDAEIDEGLLREHLRSRLPYYMVPTAFVLMESMPLNSSRKVDRRRLPDPRLSRPAFVAPEGPVENSLAGLWSEVLGTVNVGADDDFFALGGHSLSAARLAAMIRELFGVELSIRTIFERRTVASLSSAVTQQVREEVSGMSDEDIAAALRELEPPPDQGPLGG